MEESRDFVETTARKKIFLFLKKMLYKRRNL